MSQPTYRYETITPNANQSIRVVGQYKTPAGIDSHLLRFRLRLIINRFMGTTRVISMGGLGEPDYFLRNLRLAMFSLITLK
jgi:hypothetical protein